MVPFFLLVDEIFIKRIEKVELIFHSLLLSIFNYILDKRIPGLFMTKS